MLNHVAITNLTAACSTPILPEIPLRVFSGLTMGYSGGWGKCDINLNATVLLLITMKSSHEIDRSNGGSHSQNVTYICYTWTKVGGVHTSAVCSKQSICVYVHIQPCYCYCINYKLKTQAQFAASRLPILQSVSFPF